MRTRVVNLGLCLLVAWLALPVLGGEIEPRLAELMATKGPNEAISAIVVMATHVDIVALESDFQRERATLEARHTRVISEALETATASQRDLVTLLEQMQRDGRVQEFRPYWITNAIRVDAPAAVLTVLAQRSDVSYVILNHEVIQEPPVSVGEPLRDEPDGPTTGLQAMLVPQAWALGYDGTGVLVATLDSGVSGTHPALASRWAGTLPQYAGHPEWAWNDPALGLDQFPFDYYGHGTHTMGTICGGAPGLQIGVAPGARWISSAALGAYATDTDVIESFQWIVDPDGNPLTSWDVPAVCSNSWSSDPTATDPCWDYVYDFEDMCEAAGVLILHSAGNSGDYGLGSPAARAADAYRTLAVGALDCDTVPGIWPATSTVPWPVPSWSSRGPSYCTPSGTWAYKPDVAAPGVSVLSAYVGGQYLLSSGTSMAAPHVAGVVALIRQANPNLSVSQVKQVLYDTAIDMPPTGMDNASGRGLINAEAAVRRALDLLLDQQGRVTLDRPKYRCDGTVTVLVRDTGLNQNPQIAETVAVLLTSSSEPTGESVLCTETGPDTARFVGTLALAATNAPGVLHVAAGQTIQAAYNDANNGQGVAAVVTATAAVDCTGPVVESVETVEIDPYNGTITCRTNEPARGRIIWGSSCDALVETLNSGEWYSTGAFWDEVPFSVRAPRDGLQMHYRLELEDEAGNWTIESGCRTFALTDLFTMHTHIYEDLTDLANTQIVFEPVGGTDTYSACRSPINALPTDPDGGTALVLNEELDNSPFLAPIDMPVPFPFYGQTYSRVWAGLFGYVSLDGLKGEETRYYAHFDYPRISVAFGCVRGPLGSVTYRALSDRVAITWDNIEWVCTGAGDPPGWATMQVELYYSGRITLNYLNNTLHDVLVGLSDGRGTSAYTDQLYAEECGALPPTLDPQFAQVPVNAATQLELRALDDGLPGPLSFTIHSLPAHGALSEPGGTPITAVPHTLPAHGNVIVYTPHTDYFGADAFQVSAADGGTPPTGGSSAIAVFSLAVALGPPVIDPYGLPLANAGLPYSQPIPVTGGNPPFTWTLLPAQDYYEIDLGENLFQDVGTYSSDGAIYGLPWLFPYYGELYQAAFVSYAGVLGFDYYPPGDYEWDDGNEFYSYNVVAICSQRHLELQSPGDGIYLAWTDDSVTFRWKATEYESWYVNHAVTLFRDGRIRFDYGDINLAGSFDWPWVGVSFGHSQRYLLSKYNLDRLHMSWRNSVEFRPYPPLAGPLTLSPAGVLSGTPAEAGALGQFVRVTDALGRTAEAVVELNVRAQCAGDMNCDGMVLFADINLFVEALTGGESAWGQAHPDCPWRNADCNNDGRVTFADINPFVLTIGAMCPE